MTQTLTLRTNFTTEQKGGFTKLIQAASTTFLGMSLRHFVPRCMECQRGLAMRKLSVCQMLGLRQNG